MKAKKWTISGYAGEHDEAGACIKNERGQIVCSTAGIRANAPEATWREYYDIAELIRSAPEMKIALQCHEDRSRAQTLIRQGRHLEAVDIANKWYDVMIAERITDHYKAPEQNLKFFMHLPGILRRRVLSIEEKE